MASKGGNRKAGLNRHCEERSDEAIQARKVLDCFVSLAMTTSKSSRNLIHRLGELDVALGQAAGIVGG
jgi:hypothetical protein